jgi:hypothetical protein
MIDANFLSPTNDNHLENVQSPAAKATQAQFIKPCTEDSVPERDDSTASLDKSPTSPISDPHHSLVDVTSKK